MSKVKLVTSEGEVVEVDVEVASKSVLIKGMIDDSGVEEEIPLPNVKRAVLEKIVQYCTYIK
jgi:S-phase kinase-associated protein 1